MASKWIDLGPTSPVLPATDVKPVVSQASTDGEVPSAKCLHTLLGSVEQQLHLINYGDDTPQWWGLRIVAEEDGAKVNMTKTGSPPAVGILYSLDDGNTWTAFDADGGSTEITLQNEGDYVCFKAGVGGNTRFASGDNDYRTFALTGKCGAYGNVMSLLDGTDDETATAVTMGNFAFRQLFYQCANLTHAPDLPAPTLSEYCYDGMFRASGITAAPDLPAQSVLNRSYRRMFSECSSLVVAPTFGCVSMAEMGAVYMFYQTAIESVEIPATDVKTFGYKNMFEGCSNLTSVKVAITGWVEVVGAVNLRTTDWLVDVPASGTFKCPAALGTDSTIQRGTSYCPTGWTVVNI